MHLILSGVRQEGHVPDPLSVVRQEGHVPDPLSVVRQEGHVPDPLSVARQEGHVPDPLSVVMQEGHVPEAEDQVNHSCANAALGRPCGATQEEFFSWGVGVVAESSFTS